MSNIFGLVANKVVYYWRVFGKILSFFIFGVGAIILFIAVFPVMRICIHPQDRYLYCARFFISKVMSLFVYFMRFIRVISISIDDKALYKNLNSKIVIANHPSLLDVVFLISLIPNANCIVRSALVHTVVGGVVKSLYIPNDGDFDELVSACKTALERGECLIIFPEGTRSPHEDLFPFRKGFARIALATGCDIVPIFIGGNKKFGLKKGDSLFSFHPTEKYYYSFSMMEKISITEYYNVAPRVGIRQIVQDSRDQLHQYETGRDLSGF